MEYKEYKLIAPFSASSIYPRRTFDRVRRFAAGDKVMATEVTDAKNVKFYITKDGFAIAFAALEPVAPVAITAKAGEVLPTELKAKLDEIKNKDIVKDIVRKSRSSVNGLMIGAGAGLVAAIVFRKPLLMSVIIGSASCGFAGYYISKKTGNATKLKPVAPPAGADAKETKK